jgi:hypothetical protein
MTVYAGVLMHSSTGDFCTEIFTLDRGFLGVLLFLVRSEFMPCMGSTGYLSSRLSSEGASSRGFLGGMPGGFLSGMPGGFPGGMGGAMP